MHIVLEFDVFCLSMCFVDSSTLILFSIHICMCKSFTKLNLIKFHSYWAPLILDFCIYTLELILLSVYLIVVSSINKVLTIAILIYLILIQQKKLFWKLVLVSVVPSLIVKTLSLFIPLIIDLEGFKMHFEMKKSIQLFPT